MPTRLDLFALGYSCLSKSRKKSYSTTLLQFMYSSITWHRIAQKLHYCVLTQTPCRELQGLRSGLQQFFPFYLAPTSLFYHDKRTKFLCWHELFPEKKKVHKAEIFPDRIFKPYFNLFYSSTWLAFPTIIWFAYDIQACRSRGCHGTH